MELNTFISSLNKPIFATNKSVICFRGKQEYPLLFFSSVLQKIKVHTAIETIDVNEQDFVQIIVRLQTSFLGMRTVYWLRNISGISKIKREKLLQYVQTYSGPNIVAFFASHEDIPKINTITWLDVLLPDEVDVHMYVFIMQQLFDITLQRSMLFTTLIAKQHKRLSLDMLCLLVHYDVVLGKNVQIFLDKWLDQLIIPQTSFFTLSKYFFSKDARSFFPYWAQMVSLYSPQFWVAFWSEQLWRASGFIMFVRKKQRDQAKQISFRLPFTFLQKDWRSYSVRELKKAHQFVYETDYNLKHGGSPIALDLFFSKFFCNQFV